MLTLLGAELLRSLHDARPADRAPPIHHELDDGDVGAPCEACPVCALPAACEVCPPPPVGLIEGARRTLRWAAERDDAAIWSGIVAVTTWAAGFLRPRPLGALRRLRGYLPG